MNKIYNKVGYVVVGLMTTPIFASSGFAEEKIDFARQILPVLSDNCFVCHGGKVAGQTVPGAGNTHIDLTTVATDIQRLRALEAGRDPQSVPESKAPFKTPLNFAVPEVRQLKFRVIEELFQKYDFDLESNHDFVILDILQLYSQLFLELI